MSSNPENFSLPKVITTNIDVNRMARQLEGNTGKYNSGEKGTAGGKCGRGSIQESSLYAISMVYYGISNAEVMYCGHGLVW
jgi:hypothetical protein